MDFNYIFIDNNNKNRIDELKSSEKIDYNINDYIKLDIYYKILKKATVHMLDINKIVILVYLEDITNLKPGTCNVYPIIDDINRYI